MAWTGEKGIELVGKERRERVHSCSFQLSLTKSTDNKCLLKILLTPE